MPKRISALQSVPDADHAVRPRLSYRLREWLTVAQYLQATRSRGSWDSWPEGDGHPVMVLPGLMGGPASTEFLRRWLSDRGYTAYDWGFGINRGLQLGLEDHLRDRLHQIAERHNSTVSLIGWSAGGMYAREMAREEPGLIRSVITLGSPLRGNVRATHAYRLFVRLSNKTLAAERLTPEKLADRELPIDVPMTCIFSRFDGIVAWECCTTLPSDMAENIEVQSTHLGYGHDQDTLHVIADRLAQPEGQWVRWADRHRRSQALPAEGESGTTVAAATQNTDKKSRRSTAGALHVQLAQRSA